MAMYKIGKTLRSMESGFFETLADAQKAIKGSKKNIYRLQINKKKDTIGYKKVTK